MLPGLGDLSTKPPGAVVGAHDTPITTPAIWDALFPLLENDTKTLWAAITIKHPQLEANHDEWKTVTEKIFPDAHTLTDEDIQRGMTRKQWLRTLCQRYDTVKTLSEIVARNRENTKHARSQRVGTRRPGFMFEELSETALDPQSNLEALKSALLNKPSSAEFQEAKKRIVMP
jgi:hypothetical protein